MTKSIAALLVCLLALELTAVAGLGSDKTAYIGGTESQIKDGTEGQSSAKDEKVFVFEYKSGKVEIPYDQVNDLEYGQKAGRRLGLALTVSPWLLLSHKRRHFLTIGWKDAQDKQHAAVLELGKSIVRTTIVTLEARTLLLCPILTFAVVSGAQTKPSAATALTQPCPGSIAPAHGAQPVQLQAVKRIFVETFGEDMISKEMQSMVVSSLVNSKRFIVTENALHADAVLKGVALEKTSQELHAYGEGTSVGSAAGGHHSNVNGGNGGISGSSSGGFVARAMGINDSSLNTETIDNARIAVRLVNSDGDVIWTTTQESKGGKYKGASADVADMCVKQLLRDIGKVDEENSSPEAHPAGK